MTATKRELLALSGAALAALAGCLDDRFDPVDREDDDDGDDDPTDDPNDGSDPSADRVDPDVDPETVEALVRGNTTFAFDLFDELVAEEPDADHFVSPYSISTALAMTWAGARGDTEEEMADALSFPHDQDDLHPSFNALDRELEARGESEGGDENGETEGGDPFELNVANALWPREGFPLREEFLETAGDHYGAALREMDFVGAPEASREEINDWVADETEDRIEDLLPEGSIDGNTVLVLTNAIYFLAGWLYEFDEGATRDAEFTALDGSTDEVAMMSQSETFPYAEVDGHQLVELPYVGEETSMVVMLPAADEFETFEADLDADRLDELFAELESQHGRVELPRFELETSYSLPDVMAELGMEGAFTGEADFSGMVEGGGIWIDDIFHDAFVAVDEEGTEAAAATAVVMDESAPMTQFELTVDRPFLFLIRDRPTDSVLFLGRVVEVPEDPS